MILLATALLATRPLPDRATVVGWLGANVCRCTGYQMIVESVEWAAGHGGPGPAARQHAGRAAEAGLR